jgi:hypothetical protein
MFLAIGVILLNTHAVPQATVPRASAAAVESNSAQGSAATGTQMLADASGTTARTPFEPGRLVLTPVAVPASPVAADPAPIAPAMAPAIAPVRKPIFTGRIKDGQRRAWITLAIAQHGAAGFDAWSTRRAISRNGAQELNPMLKPFANNGSIYAATQVAPLLLDILGRRMMTSNNPLLRHTWWLPQALGTAASIAGGAHNLGVR